MSDNALETLNPNEVKAELQRTWDAAYVAGDLATCEVLERAISFMENAEQVMVVQLLKETELYNALTRYKTEIDMLRASRDAAYEEGRRDMLQSLQAQTNAPVHTPRSFAPWSH